MTTATEPDLLTISEVAAHANTTTSVLRMWEHRYGWPAPRRTGGGVRRFTRAEAELLRQVVARVDAGTNVGDVIVDGRPHLLPYAEKPAHVHLDLSHLPSPTTDDGKATQRDLLLGIVQRHPGRIRAAVAHCVRLHPSDRGPAVFLVLAAVRQQQPDHAWFDRILDT